MSLSRIKSKGFFLLYLRDILNESFMVEGLMLWLMDENIYIYLYNNIYIFLYSRNKQENRRFPQTMAGSFKHLIMSSDLILVIQEVRKSGGLIDFDSWSS